MNLFAKIHTHIQSNNEINLKSYSQPFSVNTDWPSALGMYLTWSRPYIEPVKSGLSPSGDKGVKITLQTVKLRSGLLRRPHHHHLIVFIVLKIKKYLVPSVCSFIWRISVEIVWCFSSFIDRLPNGHAVIIYFGYFKCTWHDAVVNFIYDQIE